MPAVAVAVVSVVVCCCSAAACYAAAETDALMVFYNTQSNDPRGIKDGHGKEDDHDD